MMQGVTFNPTFKFDVGTDMYDSSKKRRTPAYCDRCKKKKKNHTYCMIYHMCIQIRMYVYKYALFFYEYAICVYACVALLPTVTYTKRKNDAWCITRHICI